MEFRDLYTPQPKQREAFNYIGRKSRILYGGARGGAKTSFSVWAAVSAALQFPGLRVGIVRKTHKELREQIIENELLKHFPEKLGLYRYAKSNKTAYFPNGSMIYFISLQNPGDIKKEQGIERGLYILDEGNHLPWTTIIKLLGSNRSGSGIVNARGERWKDTMIITANPGGICDNEIKYRWVKPDYSRWTEDELKNKDEYVFIQAKVYDNRHVSESYIDTLKAMPEYLRRAWLDGDWDVNSGAFFEEWNPDIHVVETLPGDVIKPPKDWAKWRAIDMGGGTHPSVCLWLCQDPDTGDVYVYNEYSTLAVTDVFIDGVIAESEGEEYIDGYGDPAMFTKNHDYQFDESPAQMFLRRGVWLQKANNEREIGWRNLKQWLHWTETQMPKLKILNRCWRLVETIPIQQYVDNKFDLNTRGEDDLVDALRYGITPLQFGYVYNRIGQMVALGDQPILKLVENGMKERDVRSHLINKTHSDRAYYVPGTNIEASIYSIF